MTSRTGSPLVLLVDDFADAREMYAEYLTFSGFRVVTAGSGSDALTVALQPERPALILMDLQMNGVTGTTALELLRQDPTFADVPIIAFTAHAMADERNAALLAGFDAVITKPCLPDELIRLIEPYLTKSRAATL